MHKTCGRSHWLGELDLFIVRGCVYPCASLVNQQALLLRLRLHLHCIELRAAVERPCMGCAAHVHSVVVKLLC